jgi:hypothetical protein
MSDHKSFRPMTERSRLVVVSGAFTQREANQGRFVRPDGALHWAQMTFSTQSELALARALDRAGLFFAPLPACRVTYEGGERKTRELDFLLIDHGVPAVVELDGCAHEGRAADDHRRDRALKRAGIYLIERFPSVEALKSPEEIVRVMRGMIRHYRQTL